MSRDFRIWLNTTVATHDEASDVEDVFSSVWPMQESSIDPPSAAFPGTVRVSLRGDGSLNGGKHFYTIVTELKREIWRRLRRYVDVHVAGTSLEPNDTVMSTVTEFERMRDTGQLQRYCCDCGHDLKFESCSDQCEICKNMDAMEDKRDG